MARQPGALQQTLLDGTAGGGVLSVLNDSGETRIVTQIILDVTTGSTADASVDVGIANDATTAAANLMANIEVSDAGVFDMLTNSALGTGPNRWLTGKYLNISASNATDPDGLVGSAFINWITVT
jgi:hypothetical protein